MVSPGSVEDPQTARTFFVQSPPIVRNRDGRHKGQDLAGSQLGDENLSESIACLGKMGVNQLTWIWWTCNLLGKMGIYIYITNHHSKMVPPSYVRGFIIPINYSYICHKPKLAIPNWGTTLRRDMSSTFSWFYWMNIHHVRLGTDTNICGSFQQWSPQQKAHHHITVEITIPPTQLTKTLRICHRYSKIAVQPPVLTGVMLVGWRVQLLSL